MKVKVTLVGRDLQGRRFYEVVPIEADSVRDALKKAERIVENKNDGLYWHIEAVNGSKVPVFGTHSRSHKYNRKQMNRAERRAGKVTNLDEEELSAAQLRKLGKKKAGGYVYRTAGGKQGID